MLFMSKPLCVNQKHSIMDGLLLLFTEIRTPQYFSIFEP
jgi:hypothetical protein